MFLFKVIRTRLAQSRVSTTLVVELDVVLNPPFCLLWHMFLGLGVLSYGCEEGFCYSVVEAVSFSS